MKDCVERSEVIRILRKIAEPGYSKGSFTGPVGAAMWEIDHLPAAPVREVVLCRECKWFDLAEHECNSDSVCYSGRVNFYDDDFCSYGQKRPDTEAKNPKID